MRVCLHTCESAASVQNVLQVFRTSRCEKSCAPKTSSAWQSANCSSKCEYPHAPRCYGILLNDMRNLGGTIFRLILEAVLNCLFEGLRWKTSVSTASSKEDSGAIWLKKREENEDFSPQTFKQTIQNSFLIRIEKLSLASFPFTVSLPWRDHVSRSVTLSASFASRECRMHSQEAFTPLIVSQGCCWAHPWETLFPFYASERPFGIRTETCSALSGSIFASFRSRRVSGYSFE